MTVSTFNISRTPLVETDKSPSEAPLSALSQHSLAPQPFTDLLVEATSQVLRDGLEKPEVSGIPSHGEGLTKALASRVAKEEHPETRSKKSVSIDKSAPPVIVAPAPVIVIESVPIAVPKFAPLAGQALPKQARVDAVTAVDVKESKPLAMAINIDVVKEPGIERSVGKDSESVVPTIGEPLQTVPFENAGPTLSHDQKPIATAEPIKSVGATSEIRSVPIPRASDLAVAPDAHVSLPSALLSPTQVTPIHLRESSTPAITKEPVATKESTVTKDSVPTKVSIPANGSELAADHFPPKPVRIEHVEPGVVPVWPIHPSIAAPTVNAVAFSSHIASSPTRPLDVAALVGAISRPLDEARGGYTVMIAMHPVELGHVQAVVTLHGSDLHVSITPQTQMGHQALTHAVETLKTELSRGGVNVNVTLQDPGSQPGGENRHQLAPAPREVFSPEESAVVASAPPALSANQVNLVL